HHQSDVLAECSTHVIDQIQEPQPKHVNIYKHQTTEEELAILIPLVNTTPTEEQLNLALEALLKISKHWT
ncbi:16034_t:CDS:1, partial [Funneliformis geosporum]